jgi:outer membrane protein TolC
LNKSLNLGISETSYSLTELDVKEQVKSSYYLILITEKLLDVVAENTKNLEDIAKHTGNMFSVGVAEQTDVDQIKINLTELKNSKKQIERQLEQSYNMFRFLLGLESGSNVVLKSELDDMVSKINIQAAKVDSFDVNVNPGYQIMDIQEKLNEKQVNIEKWSYSPSLVGFYSYKEKMLTTAFDLSPKHAAGLSLSVPIFASGIKRAKVSQAKIELEKTRTNKSLMEEQLLLQFNQLSFELNNANENYLTQKENVEVAKRVFNSYNNKYNQGMVSSLELTQANSNYLQAESNYVSSVLTLLQAKLALDKLFNNI